MILTDMGARSTILMLHGFTGCGASWRPVTARLDERYRAITPDIRGHASAAGRRPVDLAGVLDDVGAALRDAGLDSRQRFTLVGYSQGGRIALHAALDPRFKDRVDCLILIGASPGIASAAERERRRLADERLACEFEQLAIEQIAERWARTPILGGITAEQAAQARAERLRSTPAGLAAALRGLGTGALPSLWERLAEITAPVTMVSGARDTKFGHLSAQMVALMPAARACVVPGAGHAVQLEDPEAITKIICHAVQGAHDASTTRASRISVRGQT